jgi:lysophospholipase L1-like esterase
MTETKFMKRAVVLIATSLCMGQVWAQAANPGSGSQTGHAPQAADTSDQLSLQVAQMKSQLADWANLHRYREENAALAPVAKGEKRVVFYGDSITDFWGRKTGTFFPGKPYINRGIWGQTTPQLLIRFQQDVIHLNPAIVIVLAGTNDIAGNTGRSTPQMIEDNLAAMAAIAKQSGVKMVIASILPADHYWWSLTVQPVDAIRTVNQWLKSFCSQNGLVYLDYYDSMVDSRGGMREGLSSDGVHPTAQGYDVMASLAEQAITKASK